MTIRYFSRKPVDVKALEWDGTNVQEMIDFTHGDFQLASGKYPFVFNTDERTMFSMQTGDFVVEVSEYRYLPFTAEELRKYYDEIPE